MTRSRHLPAAPALAAALALAVALPAGAATLHVPADHATIGAALGAAAAGDTVLVAPGTWQEHDLVLPSGVTLRGATGAPADVVIDAQRAGRCVYGANLAAGTRLEALTLSNGLPAWGSTPHNSWGAGLMVEGGEPAVTDCVFTANETAVGGGAFVIGSGAPVFERCDFVANTATETAGLLLHGTCDPIVRECTFRDAYGCLLGGGVTWSGAGEALLEDCAVLDNTVMESAGGVEILGSGATMILRNCEIRGNHADLDGGGLYAGHGGRAVLEGGTIAGNTAGTGGGGVVVAWNSLLEAENTVIRGNTAPAGPDGAVWATGAAVLTCCDTDPDAWAGDGTLTIVDDGCAIPTEDAGWGSLKARFR